jgi:hypothetical protein
MPPQTQKFLFGLAAGALLLAPILSFFIDWRLASGRHTWIAAALFACGSIFCAANFYLVFVRVPLLMWRGTAPETIRNVSSFPILGMAILPGLMLAPPSLGLSAASLLLVLGDTGNICWFVATMWNHEAFWNYEAKGNDAPDGP